jgi:hypothetical protein
MKTVNQILLAIYEVNELTPDKVDQRAIKRALRAKSAADILALTGLYRELAQAVVGDKPYEALAHEEKLYTVTHKDGSTRTVAFSDDTAVHIITSYMALNDFVAIELYKPSITERMKRTFNRFSA